jgi:hypothetical protein
MWMVDVARSHRNSGRETKDSKTVNGGSGRFTLLSLLSLTYVVSL